MSTNTRPTAHDAETMHSRRVTRSSGGVESYAVQLAKAPRDAVTAMVSAARSDLVRDLGADHVVAQPEGDGVLRRLMIITDESADHAASSEERVQSNWPPACIYVMR